MARFDIKSKDGQSTRFRGAPKYNGVFGKPSYLEFAEIASPTPIAWEIGDYVDYTRTGLRYKLYSIPQVAKSATRDKNGDSFVYKNVQFYCATKDLEIALFRDLVEYDNTIHFSSVPNVDTYEDVYGIASRIQANMDDFAPGAWNIQVFSTTDADVLAELRTVRQFSVSDGTCLDALNQIYNLWHGIGWIYSYESDTHTITIGRPNVQNAGNTTSEFSYGNGNGLKVISRAVSSKNEMATRVYAYGSDRNMPTRYYNNLSPGIKDAESVYIPHLMLPLTDWGTTASKKDARLAYLQNSDAVAAYGLIPKVLRFDGSNGLEDIYPSIEGMTVGSVADQDFPSTGWNSSDRIDEVYSAENPSDDGQYTESSEKIKQSVTRDIADPNKTYATVAGQEAVTIANDSALFTTSSSMSAGKYVINMGELGGSIVATDGDFAEVPKGFLEIYIGSNLETSKEIKVVAGYTRIENEYLFSVPNATFTTEHSGIVKAFIRFEAKIPKSASVMSIAYNLGATTATINVEYSIASTFVVSVPQLGFDLNTVGTSTDGLATISMTSGKCAGRDFVVKKAEYNTTTHTWDLTCQRQDDTSLMLYFPNSVYTIENGDRFVLLDIQMPSKFVTAAMTRLHNAASNALARLCKPRMVYTPEVDSKEVYMSEIPLMEGLYMPVYDTDLISVTGNTEWVLIDSVTIAENDDAIPIWSVTLRDEKAESMLASLTRELADAKGRLRDWDADDSRKPAKDDVEAVLIPTVVGVQIQSDRNFFAYTGDNTPQTIVLTAVTSGINNPTYQWYYLGESDWVALSGETAQTYSVLNNSQIYYQNGEIVEDFKVIVTDGSDSWSDQIQVTKLTGSVTIALSNPVHLFAGEVETAVDNQSDSTTVVAYVGDSLAVATVNSISGAVTGMTASVRANTNNTTAPIIDIAVTDDLTTPNGELTINVTAGGITRDLTYSWAIAFKGEGSGSAGLSNAMVYLYKRASSAPSIDWQTTLTYSFVNKALTSVPSGWSQTIPAHTGDPLYVTAATASSRSDTDDIEYTEWATPVMLAEDGADGANGTNGTNGTNGLNSASVFLYQRAASQPNKPSGTFTYTFATGVLSVASGSLGDWSQTIPSGSDPCWVTQATAISSDATDTINGSEFSTVKKLVEDGVPGDDGLNTATVTLYRRATSTPSVPSATLTYTFATGALSGTHTNWYQSVPSGANPCYVIQAYVASSSATATITSSDWEGPTILVQNGADGQNGTNGTNGTDGDSVEVQWSSDGVNWHSNYQSGDLYMRQRIGSSGSWGNAIRVVGEDGDTIYTSFVFKASDTKPSAPTGTSPIPSGWYDAPPSETETTLVPTYDSNFVTSGTPHLATITHSQSIWGKASFTASAGDVVKVTVRASSENNYDWGYLSVLDDDSHSTDSSHYVAKISGTNTATREFTIPTTGTHFFCVGYTKDSSQSSNDDTIYVDSVKVVETPRIWMSCSVVTDGVSDGNWSDPIEVSGRQGPQGPQGIPGQDGLMGKIMRGINEWSQYGLGTSSSPVNYEGRSSTDPTHIYYDVVYHDNNGTKVYYYCENEEYNGHPARYYEPNVTAGWANCWVEATHYDFIATKVLLADNAFIDVMSGNAIYMRGSGGTVVAGMQGGSGINFFAGSSTPATAPFRVSYDGSFVSTMGQVGGYTYDDNGLTYYANVTGSSQNGYHCIYQKDSFEIMWRDNGRTNQVIADVQPSANQVMKIEQGFGNKPALVIDGYSGTSVALDVTGDIQRNAESVVTANDLSLTKDPILHIVHCTQTEYNNLSTYDSNTMYVIE